jgi:2-C-methyl-D-erythritol 4-phosphate cytidylyltransferase
MSIIVILPAAGAGSRFGGEIPKQFRTLGGKPILQHVIERFLFDERVERVIVPVQEALVSTIGRAPGDRVLFVAGGETRQESVRRGLDAAGDGLEIVAVHDAVRPFFSLEVFHDVVDAARKHGAAFPALPVADTIHVVNDDRIAMTPDRRFLVAAQTPQCFKAEILRDVLERAARDGDDATDEAGLAAKYGYTVRPVPGDSLNFKITRPEDLVMAERIFAEWGES